MVVIQMAKEGKKTFAEKYPPLDERGIKEEIKGQETAKTVFAARALEIEKNFTAFNEVLDPIQWKNPQTGKTVDIALVRRPTMKEIKALVPPEMAKYIGKKAPEEMEKKYAHFMYERMADLIVLPDKTAKEWEADGNPWFLRRFWQHIADIQRLIEGQSEGF